MDNQEYNKWVYTKASKIDSYYRDCKPFEDLSADVLIKAMWAINREGIFFINTLQNSVFIDTVDQKNGADIAYYFLYKDHNNSEQEALDKALRYIYSETS